MTVKELVKVIDKYTCYICSDLEGNIYYDISPIEDCKVKNIYVKNFYLYNPLKDISEEVIGIWIKIQNKVVLSDANII